ITLARRLSEGNWLGQYDQFTLMKGPGYPAFLALSSVFGISTQLARSLFHCAAIAIFVAICHRFLRSYLLSGLLFTLLLLDPGSFQGQQLRILRDTIYYAQSLLCVGILSSAFLMRNVTAGVAGGLMFGW